MTQEEASKLLAATIKEIEKAGLKVKFQVGEVKLAIVKPEKKSSNKK